MSYFLFEILLILTRGIKPVRSGISFALSLSRSIISCISLLLSYRNLSIRQFVELNDLFEQIGLDTFQLLTKRLLPLHTTGMGILRRNQIRIGIRISLERQNRADRHHPNRHCARYVFQYI